tara:strand:+ start:213 stop:431 length:219 start_codon:yes stop_codon:yes gene_type:complete
MKKILKKYKYHYYYAKQYGDIDIMLTYYNKIEDLLAQEIYGEFGYDTCSPSEKRWVSVKAQELLLNKNFNLN